MAFTDLIVGKWNRNNPIVRSLRLSRSWKPNVLTLTRRLRGI